MAIVDKLHGKYIDLVCADIEDAEFTLNIRKDLRLTKYIPLIDNNIDKQEKWIISQRDNIFDVFFVIKRHDGSSIGTISYYDYDKGHNTCEVGRYISYGNSYENIEAAMLLIEDIFSRGINNVILNNHENNSAVISLWKRFGAKYNCSVIMSGWTAAQYILNNENYYKNCEMIKRLLRY